MRPERLPHEPRDLEEHGPAFLPPPVADEPVLDDQPPERRQDQHHRVIGDLLDERVRDVGHRDALRRRREHVHRVHADAAERDDLAAIEPVDHRLGDAPALRVEGVGVARRLGEVRLGSRGDLDDLRSDRRQRLHLQVVALARRPVAHARRCRHLEFRHVAPPRRLESAPVRRCATSCTRAATSAEPFIPARRPLEQSRTPARGKPRAAFLADAAVSYKMGDGLAHQATSRSAQGAQKSLHGSGPGRRLQALRAKRASGRRAWRAAASRRRPRAADGDQRAILEGDRPVDRRSAARVRDPRRARGAADARRTRRSSASTGSSSGWWWPGTSPSSRGSSSRSIR